MKTQDAYSKIMKNLKILESRTLNQAWGPSKHGVPCDSTQDSTVQVKDTCGVWIETGKNSHCEKKFTMGFFEQTGQLQSLYVFFFS